MEKMEKLKKQVATLNCLKAAINAVRKAQNSDSGQELDKSDIAPEPAKPEQPKTKGLALLHTEHTPSGHIKHTLGCDNKKYWITTDTSQGKPAVMVSHLQGDKLHSNSPQIYESLGQAVKAAVKHFHEGNWE